MKHSRISAVFILLVAGGASAQPQGSVLFIGNSFTFGWGSPVRFYRNDTVTDLNAEGIGGVPALFKSFADQAGLDYDVFLETRPGSGLDYHLENKRDVIARHTWDAVVMHGYSTLDRDKPGDGTLLASTAREMSDFLRAGSPAAALYLMATWSRPDQVYLPSGAWAGTPIETMARDVRHAYDMAAEEGQFAGVIPVGEAWIRAIHTGIADANPYDGIEPEKLNLWSYDNYHGSAHGYYLEALVIFGTLTQRDPRSLGEYECSGFELGLSPAQIRSLQEVAWAELESAGAVLQHSSAAGAADGQERCSDPH